MTAFACHRGPWPGLFFAFACTVFAGASNTAFATEPVPVSAAGGMVVHLDQAKIVKPIFYSSRRGA